MPSQIQPLCPLLTIVLLSRKKLQHDPNNTKWLRDTSTFGQKILRAQGWQPGEYLGAKDAPHSELHGAANASYIRVTLKDDMKGLGFDKRKDDETAGLAEFSDLLSRLNGKSTAKVEEEKEKRAMFRTNAYVHNRYGPMRFVKGGLLVGDEMKEDKAAEPVTEPSEDENKDSSSSSKSKKRKADPSSEEAKDATSDGEAQSKKRRTGDKKSKKRSSSEEEDDTEGRKSKSRKKEKKSKSKRSKSDSEERAALAEPAAAKTEEEPPESSASSEDESSRAKKSKDERREEKRARKEQKKREKEEKRRRKAEAKARGESTSGDSSTLPSSTNVTAASTPPTSGTSTPRPNPGRVRSRFLAAKREAMMNDKALAKVRSHQSLAGATLCSDSCRSGWSRHDLNVVCNGALRIEFLSRAFLALHGLASCFSARYWTLQMGYRARRHSRARRYRLSIESSKRCE